MNFSRISLYLGAFATMALPNAVVPVLALITSDTAVQGALYSAYFLGAFFMVFPAGWISDKIGRAPLIKIGLAGTFVSWILIWYFTGDPLLTVGFRFLEGLFTGMFVSSALYFVNSQPEHTKLSGLYLALMNVGMVAGLVIPGILSLIHPYAGVLVFSFLTGFAFLAGIFFRDGSGFISVMIPVRMIFSIALYHKWLWAALFIFAGATGVVTSMYPEMSGYSAEISGVVTALMSVSTAVCIYAVSHLSSGFSGISPAFGVHPRSLGSSGFLYADRHDSCRCRFWHNFGRSFQLYRGHSSSPGHDEWSFNNHAVWRDGGIAVYYRSDRYSLGISGRFIIVVACVLLGGLLVVRCPCYAPAVKNW